MKRLFQRKNLLSRTHRTSSQEDADNQYCFTARALQVTCSGKWIYPNHPFKCSQILQMVRAEADVFWGAIHFSVHPDSLRRQCRVWDIPIIPSLLSEDGSCCHFRGDSSHLVSEVHKTSVCTGASLLNV